MPGMGKVEMTFCSTAFSYSDNLTEEMIWQNFEKIPPFNDIKVTLSINKLLQKFQIICLLASLFFLKVESCHCSKHIFNGLMIYKSKWFAFSECSLNALGLMGFFNRPFE